jgi:hypothetical protein
MQAEIVVEDPAPVFSIYGACSANGRAIPKRRHRDDVQNLKLGTRITMRFQNLQCCS